MEVTYSEETVSALKKVKPVRKTIHTLDNVTAAKAFITPLIHRVGGEKCT